MTGYTGFTFNDSYAILLAQIIFVSFLYNIFKSN